MTPRRIGIAAFAALIIAAADAYAGDCSQQFDSTFEAIQKRIFETHSCATYPCHDNGAAGGLVLLPDVAYDNLVDQPIQSVPKELYPGVRRVTPGAKGNSLLWLNLAAATLPDLWHAPLRPMPLGLPPLTEDELEVIQLWIEHGAPRDGVVEGTSDLLDACLPPPGPLHAPPLPPPAAGAGIQIRAPQQLLPPASEREVCFVSYYDLTDQVPAEFRGPGGDTFRYKRVEARQDPLSHHAVVFVYEGRAGITDRRWGKFACRGGERAGQPCEPADSSACGAGSICASDPVQSVGCNGFGPGDASIGTGETSLFSTMASAVDSIDGVYAEAPLKGILVWNSHAFNLFDQETTLDIWINFEFAAPAEQIFPLVRFVDIDSIFKMAPPPFGADEVCSHHVLPKDVKLLDLTSHTHKRGKRFRVYEGRFACGGGPNNGQPCEPLGPDPGFPVEDLCSGAPCTSIKPPGAGDCDGDLAIKVDEVIAAVSIALGTQPPSFCPRADGDRSGAVSVDEIISAVSSALTPEMRNTEDSFLYVTYTYADPLVLQFHPPLELGGATSVAAERTLTFCALYDNGFADPSDVKRASTSPENGFFCLPTHCAEGRVGEECAGGPQLARDQSCDSTAGAGDGRCDACAASFGVTTDDEMFVLVGSYIDNDPGR